MPRRPATPPPLRRGPFLGRTAVASGLLTPAQLRSNCWRHLLRGVYQHVDIDLTPAARLSAVRLVVPPTAVVSGRTAAWLHGAGMLRDGEPAEVSVPRDGHLHSRPGITARHALLPADHVVTARGIAATTPARTAFDLARRDVLDGVTALDALAHDGLTDGEDVLALAAAFRGWRGVRQVPQVVALHDPRAESPQESRTRALLVLGGLPPPESQIVVRDPRTGWVVARIDLGYREIRLGLEYDGMQHAATRLADSKRENRLAALGWQLLRLTAEDLARPAELVAQVRSVMVQRLAVRHVG